MRLQIAKAFHHRSGIRATRDSEMGVPSASEFRCRKTRIRHRHLALRQVAYRSRIGSKKRHGNAYGYLV
jgi:hypothetical protein